MKVALFVVGLALVAITLLSRVPSARWWVRAADFPRSQVAVLLVLVGIAYAFFFDPENAIDVGFGLTIVACFAYQCFWIFPYTPFAPRQVLDAKPGDGSRELRLLISNVLMENQRVDDFLSLVKETDPDVIFAVETNDWWDARLRVLETDYPFSIRQPQENYYGMHFFSRLEAEASEVRFLIEDEIPSIRVTIRLRSGDRIEFFGLHPRPPDPGHDTEKRDGELLMVGREMKDCKLPAIVAGDMNDVAWSSTTRLFQKIGGLLDPRRGRGMFSTFHAGYPMLRWPLDHVFHDRRFTLVELRRLRSIGSDHFPVFAKIQLEPEAAADQAAPTPDRDDLAEADERIATALADDQPS